jgi:hypothetical protein
VRAPADFRLILRDPPACDPDTCNIYVGIDTNTQDPSFLDFYIQGEAQAWVAVGFSESPNMVGLYWGGGGGTGMGCILMSTNAGMQGGGVHKVVETTSIIVDGYSLS